MFLSISLNVRNAVSEVIHLSLKSDQWPVDGVLRVWKVVQNVQENGVLYTNSNTCTVFHENRCMHLCSKQALSLNDILSLHRKLYFLHIQREIV